MPNDYYYNRPMPPRPGYIPYDYHANPGELRLRELEQRLNEYEQRYGYIQQPRSQPDNQLDLKSVILVSSREEVDAYMPDATGAVQMFIQKGNDGKAEYVYCKQLDVGTAKLSFDAFKRIDLTVEKPAPESESNNNISPIFLELFTRYGDKLDSLFNDVEFIKKAVTKNAEPASNSKPPNKAVSTRRGNTEPVIENGAGGE